MAKMDGSSVCYSALCCLPSFWMQVHLHVGYCCSAKQQFCEADEVLVRFYQFSGYWLLNSFACGLFHVTATWGKLQHGLG